MSTWILLTYSKAGGEVDVRGCYTAVAAAHMLRLDKHALADAAGMLQYVKRCQVLLRTPLNSTICKCDPNAPTE
jgi:hypothetical protein